MVTQMLRNTTFVALLGLVGCASTPGAQPQDMSKAQHEQAAAAHEQAATPHAQAYDPAASVEKQRCGDPRRPCWTWLANPTEEHKTDAEKHRKMAADHRAAAQTLRDAEGRACVGVPDVDRDMSPFDHREDIASVTPYNTPSPGAAGVKQQLTKLHGATVTFRAVPGVTAEWLQRVVDCHLARNASMGFDMPEMAYCPLAVKGARGKVASTGNGFAITVESDDSTAAQEILRRSQALSGK
jgi:hypothetical protein